MTARDDVHFVSICRPLDSIQAGMARETLHAAGVACHVDNENFSAVRLGGGMAMGVGAMSVMVPSDQVEKAREILEGVGIECITR